jgi:hypothetical protein
MEHNRTTPKSDPCFQPEASEFELNEDLVGWGKFMTNRIHTMTDPIK